MEAKVGLASAEAEQKLLGLMCTERMAPVYVMSNGLMRDDYHWEVNALIHDAIERIVARGDIVDTTVLVSELASSDHLGLIGGEAVIHQIAASPADPAMLSQYVEIIKDRAMRRRVMAAFETGASVLTSEPDGNIAIQRVQEMMYRACDRYMHTAFSGVTGVDLKAVWETRAGVEEFIPYPYETMNHLVYGRERGTLNIWGGYSSDGKSTVGLDSFITACEAGYKCALFSLEMTQDQMVVRLLAYLTNIDATKLTEGKVETLEEQIAIDEAFAKMSTWNMRIYADPSITVSDIRTIQMREGYDYVLIDYLQRFDFKDFHEVPRFAKELKNVALSSKSAIDLLSQLTPKAINAGDNPFTRPDNHSLYGGKATANEADNIFFIWAHRSYDHDIGKWSRTGSGVLMCTKARQGATEWDLPMVFERDDIRWREK